MGVRSLPVPLVRHEAFTTEEVKALYRGATGEMRDIIGMAAHTGLRRIDCLLFDKSNYDPVKGLIRLQPVKTSRMSSVAVIAPSPLVLDVLRRRESTASLYLFPETASVYDACPQTVGQRFKRYMIKELSLNGNRGLYGFHSFRHWFRSTMTDAAVPERVIDAMMCHGQGSTTARYVHPDPDVLMEAASKLPELRANTD
jgi:integrase